MILEENWFDIIPIPATQAEVEIEQPPLEGPNNGLESGVASLLLDAMTKEIELIQFFNNLKTDIAEFQYPEINKVIVRLGNQANADLGTLQSLLAEVSPNAQNIQTGIANTEQELIPQSIENNNSIFIKEGLEKTMDKITSEDDYLAQGKAKRRKRYLNLINEGDDFEITDDNLDDWALNKVSCENYFDKNWLIDELTNKEYRKYE